MQYLTATLSIVLCLVALIRLRRRRRARSAREFELSVRTGVEYAYMSEDRQEFTRRSPEYTDNLSLLLSQPVLFRESLLRNLYGNASTPARLRWEEHRGGLVVLWEDAAAVYRNNRPGSYGDGAARRQPLCRISVDRNECTATIRDHVPLYPEDLDAVIVRAESLDGLKKKVGRWYADRYRELASEHAQPLEDLRTYDGEEFETKVRETFLLLAGSRLGSSPGLLFSAAAAWTGTLRTFLDVPCGMTPDAVETYLSLRGGWSGTKRELVKAVRLLCDDSGKHEGTV